jgi:hypothetical protein
MRTKRLTPAQWEATRQRWQGSTVRGFTMLAREVAAAFGVVITRQGLRKAAITHGWVKGGEPSTPLAEVTREGDVVGGSLDNRSPKFSTTSAPSSRQQAAEVVEPLAPVLKVAQGICCCCGGCAGSRPNPVPRLRRLRRLRACPPGL